MTKTWTASRAKLKTWLCRWTSLSMGSSTIHVDLTYDVLGSWALVKWRGQQKGPHQVNLVNLKKNSLNIWSKYWIESFEIYDKTTSESIIAWFLQSQSSSLFQMRNQRLVEQLREKSSQFSKLQVHTNRLEEDVWFSPLNLNIPSDQPSRQAMCLQRTAGEAYNRWKDLPSA